VRELIIRKQQSEEGVATVWLTTAEMGFTLTDEPNEILCPKDIREGKGSDRYLAPAISRFVTRTLAAVGGGAERDGSHHQKIYSHPKMVLFIPTRFVFTPCKFCSHHQDFIHNKFLYSHTPISDHTLQTWFTPSRP
jgi:hypothetical protein